MDCNTQQEKSLELFNLGNYSTPETSVEVLLNLMNQNNSEVETYKHYDDATTLRPETFWAAGSVCKMLKAWWKDYQSQRIK